MLCRGGGSRRADGGLLTTRFARIRGRSSVAADTCVSSVDFEEGSSLFDLLHLTEDLQELLGRPVDVVSTGRLKDRDDEIRAEAVDL